MFSGMSFTVPQELPIKAQFSQIRLTSRDLGAQSFTLWLPTAEDRGSSLEPLFSFPRACPCGRALLNHSEGNRRTRPPRSVSPRPPRARLVIFLRTTVAFRWNAERRPKYAPAECHHTINLYP